VSETLQRPGVFGPAGVQEQGEGGQAIGDILLFVLVPLSYLIMTTECDCRTVLGKHPLEKNRQSAGPSRGTSKAIRVGVLLNRKFIGLGDQGTERSRCYPWGLFRSVLFDNLMSLSLIVFTR
jgi:hypothetical protein